MRNIRFLHHTQIEELTSILEENGLNTKQFYHLNDNPNFSVFKFMPDEGCYFKIIKSIDSKEPFRIRFNPKYSSQTLPCGLYWTGVVDYFETWTDNLKSEIWASSVVSTRLGTGFNKNHFQYPTLTNSISEDSSKKGKLRPYLIITFLAVIVILIVVFTLYTDTPDDLIVTLINLVPNLLKQIR